MAVFQLFIGEPRGEAILRHKDRLARPDGVVDVTAEDVRSLGLDLDPYVSNRVWCHRALDELIAALTRSLASWEAAAREQVLRDMARATPEPWMAPMFEKRMAEDTRIATATGVIALARTAANAAGTLVYLGD